MEKKDILCSCCGRKFTRGLRIDGVSYKDKIGWDRKWRIGKSREKIYICVKCKNTAMALVRNNLAIKTHDIIDE